MSVRNDTEFIVTIKGDAVDKVIKLLRKADVEFTVKYVKKNRRMLKDKK